MKTLSAAKPYDRLTLRQAPNHPCSVKKKATLWSAREWLAPQSVALTLPASSSAGPEVPACRSSAYHPHST
jgi:hypothetical protein